MLSVVKALHGMIDKYSIEKTPLVAYSIPNTIQNVVFMHQCFHRRCPQYIFDLVSFRTDTGRLRSATTRAAVTHRPRTNLGRRAFSIALEQFASISYIVGDHEQFQKLKTYSFNVAFG